MRLLNQRDLDQAKAAEQKRVIDEGAKLAKRVDNLREVAADEETALDEFRKKTLKQIYADINLEAGKLELLKTEVGEYENRKKAALEPLTEREDALEDTEKRYQEREISIKQHEEEVSNKERLARERQEAAVNALATATARDTASNIGLLQAEQTKANAERLLKDALVVQGQVEQKKKATESFLIHREEAVALRERDATIKESDLSAREEELADGWRLLRDREALHERTLKRTQ